MKKPLKDLVDSIRAQHSKNTAKSLKEELARRLFVRDYKIDNIEMSKSVIKKIFTTLIKEKEY